MRCGGCINMSLRLLFCSAEYSRILSSPLGTFRATRLTGRSPVLMRRTEGEVDADAIVAARRRIDVTVGDTAVRHIAVPAAAAQHAVGARNGPCRVGLR